MWLEIATEGGTSLFQGNPPSRKWLLIATLLALIDSVVALELKYVGKLEEKSALLYVPAVLK